MRAPEIEVLGSPGRRPGPATQRSSKATLVRQAGRFAVVGGISTVVHLGLFAVLTTATGASQLANLVALVVATVGNTALNRRWTFGVLSKTGRARHQAQALAIFALTWGLTAGALALLHAWLPAPPTLVATLVLAAATAVSTVVRFVAMRSWIFRS